VINKNVDMIKKSSKLFSLLKLICLFSAFSALVSCQSKIHWPFTSKQAAEKREAIPYKVKGASDENRIKLKRKLDKSGAQVITMGQDYLISIPSASLFYYEAPRIKWASYPLLNIVADYLKQFRKVSVSVIAHTVNTNNERRSFALSTARARNVADYLNSQAIDARLIITEGLGSEKPIFSENTPNNSRIEITFRDVIV
jgi:intracellular multiplication protein IcmN